MNRTTRVGAALAGAALCIGAGIWLGTLARPSGLGDRRGTPDVVPDRSSAVRPEAPPGSSGTSATTAREPGGTRPATGSPGSIPLTGTRPGGRDRLDDLLAQLHAALQAGDDEGRRDLVERLAAWIGGDPQRGIEVVARFEAESDPDVLSALIEALQADPGSSRSPEMAEAFLRIARADALAARRGLALEFLAQAGLPDARLVPAALDLVRRETDPHARGIAANLLTAALERRPAQSAEVFRALGELARTDPVDAVRGMILQSLPLRLGDAAAVEAVGAVLAKDTAGGVRATAALALGDPPGGQRDRAAELLQAALGTEQVGDVRRTLVTSLVRVKKADALPLLDRLAREHPDLADHIADYRKILSTGETDMDRIWEAKQRMEIEREVPDDGDSHDEKD